MRRRLPASIPFCALLVARPCRRGKKPRHDTIDDRDREAVGRVGRRHRRDRFGPNSTVSCPRNDRRRCPAAGRHPQLPSASSARQIKASLDRGGKRCALCHTGTARRQRLGGGVNALPDLWRDNGDDGEMALDHRYRRRWPRGNPAARAIVDNAEVFVGGARHLSMVPQMGVNGSLGVARSHVAARNRKRRRRVCVLATGDPLHYGVGTTILRGVDMDGTMSPAARPLRWRHRHGRATRSSV